MQSNVVALHQLPALIHFKETHSPTEVGAMIAHLEVLPPKTVSKVYQCSHLCHTSSKCTAPGHVVI